MHSPTRRLKFTEPRYFIGGGGGGQQAAQQINSAPVPTPAPPVTSTAADVIQAQQDVAQQNLIKKSVKKTVFAGDTGGFVQGQPGGPGAPISGPTTYKR
jgi:hypothetical protein